MSKLRKCNFNSEMTHILPEIIYGVGTSITIAAIIVAPVVALWISAKLQEIKSREERRLYVFRALMTTRRETLTLPVSMKMATQKQ